MSSEGIGAGGGNGREHVPTRETAAAGTAGSSEDLGRRLASVERLVQAHDRTIKRALDVVASYLNGGAATAPGEKTGDTPLREKGR